MNYSYVAFGNWQILVYKDYIIQFLAVFVYCNNMEDICNRFPSLIKMVCINLDNQTLMKSKEANQALTNERLIWIRIIKKHCNSFKGFEEAWSKVVSKAPIV